jgi:hypothetical protein
MSIKKAHAAQHDLQSQPDETGLTEAPNDSLTLAYLRAWFEKLTEDVQDEQDSVIKELVKPWHNRGTTWAALVRFTGPVGKTPYEISPPTKIAKGQGAIQKSAA